MSRCTVDVLGTTYANLHGKLAKSFCLLVFVTGARISCILLLYVRDVGGHITDGVGGGEDIRRVVVRLRAGWLLLHHPITVVERQQE